jgi:GH24 family phage-related lysozyme (muramidase)
LLAANGLSENDSIHIGDKLKIPDTLIPTGVTGLSAVSEATGLSLSFIKNLKANEDSAGLAENQFHNKAYKDKNGNWTIGVGHLVLPSEETKYLNKTLSNAQVCTLLAEDIIARTMDIRALIGNSAYNKLPQPLKDAVTDYVFNRVIGTLKSQKELISALKGGNWAKAITLMNVDYSVKKDKNGKSQKIFLTGLSKRRLFDMYTACKIYNGKIPAEVKQAINAMYRRGIAHMKSEFSDEKTRKAVKESYNKEVRAWFGNLIYYV